MSERPRTPSAAEVNGFINAVIKGHLSKVKKDVADLGESIVNAKNADCLGGVSALHVAAKHGNLSMVRFLIQCKACPYCGFEPEPAGRSTPDEVDGDWAGKFG